MPAPQMRTVDFSATIPSDQAVEVYSASAVPANVSFLRIWNVSLTPGGIIWCSRTGQAGVNAAGSFPLAAGEKEVFQAPQAIPTNGLSAISSHDGVDATLTVEIG